MVLTEQQMGEVDATLLTGNVIAAITLVRGYTGWELGPAKDFVEARLVHLRRAHAENFRRLDASPPPLVVDPILMGQLHAAGPAKVRPVAEILRRLERLVSGYSFR